DAQSRGQHERALTLYNNSHFGPAEDALVQFEHDAQTRMNESSNRVSALQNSAISIGATLGILTIILGIAIVLIIARSLSQRVSATTGALANIVGTDFSGLRSAFDDLADGKLTAEFTAQCEPVDASGNDEIALLSRSYNTLADGLQRIASSFGETVARLRHAMTSVAKAATKLGTVSLEVSAATDQSNVAVTEISRAVEELAGGVIRQA